MATEKSLLCAEEKEIRIVLIGKVGAAKKWAAETILNSSKKDEEPSDTKISLDPEESQLFRVKIKGRDVVVFDTPGLCHTQRTDEETMEEIKTCVSRADPGLHGFLVVLDLEPFTQEEQNMVQTVLTSFGKDVKYYMMPLFVRGNELEKNGTTIREFINGSEELKKFVNSCKGKPCVTDHRNQDPAQVAELLQQISRMVEENKAEKRSCCYTADMLERAESRPGNVKKVALSIKGGALVGGTVGGATAHSVGSVIGISGGIVVGALVGGLVGAAGIVTYIRAKRCTRR